MSNFDPRVTLGQIQEFIVEVRDYTQGETLSTLLTNQMKLRAFERVMQCIGEAVKRLPAPLRESYPAVDWKGAAGLRDWIAHGYDGLDVEVLWTAAHDQLPNLEKTVRKMLADLA
jgi:uncharacterized protein with HEPN domain